MPFKQMELISDKYSRPTYSILMILLKLNELSDVSTRNK
jgi:hypothetical protein